jgi:hypothetical protein
MTTVTTTKPTKSAASKPVRFTGKGAAKRSTAMALISVLSYSQETSRAESVANMRLALGDNPSAELVAAAKLEWVIGYVAARLPASECPKGIKSDADKLDWARDLTTCYAAPAEEGKRVNKLRAGQKGRRSKAQHTIIRNGEKACSLFFAELGLTKAQGLKAKNAKAADKAKRAPSMAGSGKGKASAPVAPSHDELADKAKGSVTPDEAVLYVMRTTQALSDFAKRHAAVMPGEFAALCERFRSEAIAADKAWHEAKDAQPAKPSRNARLVTKA